MTANTTTMKGRTIHIVLAGDVDWSWNSSTEITSAPQLDDLSALNGLFVDSITFDPNAAGDKVSVRENSLSGPIIFHASGGDTYDQRTKYFYGKEFNGLFIDKDDVTSDSDAASVSIILA
jgi:hypothetical protein